MKVNCRRLVVSIIDMIDISTRSNISESIINKWNSVTPILNDKYIDNEAEITGNVAYKYKHDFSGLVMSLGVPLEFAYPHIVVNGYTSSIDYDGKNMKIKIINQNRLNLYLTQFLQDMS